MHKMRKPNARERLVYHIQELERLEELKKNASDDMKAGFDQAMADGYDTATLKVVLKLRKMTPGQRQERRALEAIYLAALGMLEGEALPETARRRLDEPPPDKRDHEQSAEAPTDIPKTETPPPTQGQPSLALKDPAEAREEGSTAADAGKRIYDNPYSAGDPCRAAWDEGWCSRKQSHGMETPEAYRRRSEKPSKDGGGGDTGEPGDPK
jgi:uncharacterized protein (UPF0335 family)